jgi:hypothetical protein
MKNRSTVCGALERFRADLERSTNDNEREPEFSPWRAKNSLASV